MAHHKQHEKLERLKEAIKAHETLSESQKSEALKHVEEWYAEDKGFGTLAQALAARFGALEPILAELGLL
ncbi:MAG: hypothetical protein GXO33_07345 [Epsilonproteobacteria bacterium]|nr:hypothetical protein [Campylobacterota bacterium]